MSRVNGARRYLLDWVAEVVVLHMPAGLLGGRLKLLALKLAGAEVHWPVWIDPDVWIRQPHNFTAGPDLVISRGAVLNCSTSLKLGQGCLIGYNAFLGTASHRVPGEAETIVSSGHAHAPITLDDDCWVGANACILPGVHLEKGAVVGSGSVVTKDVGAGQIVVGPSAQVLRSRTSGTSGGAA